MGRRRANGEGSIYQRSPTQWCASVSLGVKDGKPQRKVFYGKSRKEVADKLKAALKQIEIGAQVMTDRQTVGQFLEHWLSTQQDAIRLSTYRGYRAVVQKSLVPSLGTIQITKLTGQHIAQWMCDTKARGRKPGTIKRQLSVLRGALNQAMEWGIIQRNPARTVRLPRVPKRALHALTSQDVQAFLEAAHGERLEALLVLALFSGLRHGELLALHWNDIDWKTGAIRVRHTMTRYGAQATLSEPKTAASDRTVTVPRLVLAVLQDHRSRQFTEQRTAGNAWMDSNLIFTSRRGLPLHPDNGLRALHRVLQSAGLPPMRMHDLRHVYASLLLAQNVHPKFVQEALGHSTIGMTMDLYSHSLPSGKTEVVSRLEALLAVKDGDQ